MKKKIKLAVNLDLLYFFILKFRGEANIYFFR